MKQEFTSKNTSINKKKLPRIYNLDFRNITILDYGCGKYTEHIKDYLKNKNCYWYGYDKFNQSLENNNKALNIIADVVVCSNVLNVIKEDNIILDIINDCINHTKNYVCISVYEGDKSGIGKITKNDCYQRNQKRNLYIELLNDNGFNTEIMKGGFIKIIK